MCTCRLQWSSWKKKSLLLAILMSLSVLRGLLVERINVLQINISVQNQCQKWSMYSCPVKLGKQSSCVCFCAGGCCSHCCSWLKGWFCNAVSTCKFFLSSPFTLILQLYGRCQSASEGCWLPDEERTGLFCQGPRESRETLLGNSWRVRLKNIMTVFL